ncbi:hypothetical protein LXL04_009585 [Taraxacum kok-saghyz]
MKDGRTTYSEKHPYPRLSDKVCHLLQISYKGNRYRRLKDAGVITVKDLLTHLYTDTKHLQDILKLRASNIWNDIVNNAQASSGMFLYLDPSNQGKTGVVLNAKLQLKGLITEPHNYVPLDHLSAKQKEDNKQLVKYASEHFQTLHSFEDETSLKEYLVLCSNQSFNKSNSHGSQTMTQTPTDRGNGIVVYSNQENMSDLESPNGQVNYPTDPSTSYQTAESPVHVCEHMNNSTVFGPCMDCLINDPNFLETIADFLNHDSMGSDSDVMMVAAKTVSICTIARARTRWTKVSKLLRRNSVRERIISLSEGIQPLKKQRCF